jgi:hypothetical protein
MPMADFEASAMSHRLRKALQAAPCMRGADDDEWLWRLRGTPVAGKLVIVQRAAGGPWQLGRLPGVRGASIELLPGPVFDALADAQHFVLCERAAADAAAHRPASGEAPP